MDVGIPYYITLNEIVITDSPIGFAIHVTLLLGMRQVFIQFIHLTDTLDVLEYANHKGFQSVIVNIFHVILKGRPVLAPHDFPRLKP